jgi:ABC-type transport system substrate-binding protein
MFAISLILVAVLLPIILWFVNAKPKNYSFAKNVVMLWTLPVPGSALIQDPQLALQAKDKILLSTTYNRLIRINSSLQIEPDLLTNWNYSVKTKKFKFEINKNVRFSDGQPLSSDDVIFSFHRWAKNTSLDHDLLYPIKGARAYSLGRSERITGITKIDNHSITVELDIWEESFIFALSNPRYVVFPNRLRGLDEISFFNKPIGTGPYKVAYTSDSYTTLVSNNDYFQGAPLTQTIRIVKMDLSDALKSLESNATNNLLLYDIIDISNLKNKDLVISKQSNAETFAIILARNSQQTKNESSRKIILNMISRGELIANCFPDSKPAHNIIPPGILGSEQYNNIDGVVPRSVTMKIQKPIIFYIPSYLATSCVVDYFKRTFDKTEVNVKVAEFESLYQKLLDKTLDFWIEDLTFKSEDPLSTLNYFNSNSKEYFLGEAISELNANFNQLNLSAAMPFRAEAYRKIDSYLVNKGYVLPILYLTSYIVHTKEVKNADFLTSSKYIQEWNKIYVEKH